MLSIRRVALSVALIFILSYLSFTAQISVSGEGGLDPGDRYEGVGKSFTVLEKLDFNKAHFHLGVYGDYFTPSTSFPMGYSVNESAQIRAVGVVTRTDSVLAEGYFSDWILGFGWSQGDYLRFYSTSTTSSTASASKSFSLGYDPSTVSSMILYWDCYRKSASGSYTAYSSAEDRYSTTGAWYSSGAVVGWWTPSEDNAFVSQVLEDVYLQSSSNNIINRVGVYVVKRTGSPASYATYYIGIATATTGWSSSVWSTTFNPNTIAVGAWTYWDVPNVVVNQGTAYLYVYAVSNGVNPGWGNDHNIEIGKSIAGTAYTSSSYWYFGFMCRTYYWWTVYVSGGRETVYFSDAGGAVSYTFHSDSAGAEAGWHTCSWDLSSRIPYLASSATITFEAVQNAYATSDFRIDNVYLRIMLNKAKAVYGGVVIDLTDGGYYSLPYTTGSIMLLGCDFKVEFAVRLQKYTETSPQKFSVRNGTEVVHIFNVSAAEPRGGLGYSNYRIEVNGLPPDYSLNLVKCPEGVAHDVTSGVLYSQGKLTLPKSVVDTHGYGVYTVLCTSPNKVTKAETWVGDKSLPNNYFMRGELVQFKMGFAAGGNYNVAVYNPLGNAILNHSGRVAIACDCWMDPPLPLSSSAPLGQYVQWVTFDNGFEEGFLQHVFYIDANKAEVEWWGDVDSITVTGSVKNTRTLRATPNVRVFTLFLDTSAWSSPVYLDYPSPGGNSCYIKSLRVSSNVLTSYDVDVDVTVAAPRGVVGTWCITVQFDLGKNPTGGITCYYNHTLSASDVFTYALKLKGGSVKFTNLTLPHGGPLISAGTAWVLLYNERAPAYYEISIKLIERNQSSLIILDEKVQKIFVTGIKGKLLGFVEELSNGDGQFRMGMSKPKLIIPGNTTLMLLGVDGNGIPIKPTPTSHIWSRRLYIDASSIQISGSQEAATIKAKLYYDFHKQAGAGIKCWVTVAGTEYFAETNELGYITIMNVRLPVNNSVVNMGTSVIDDQTHSAPAEYPRWITDETPAMNYFLGVERTTLDGCQFTLDDKLVNPNQKITATLSLRSGARHVKLHLFYKICLGEQTRVGDVWILPGETRRLQIEFQASPSVGSYPLIAEVGYSQSGGSHMQIEDFVEVTGIKIDQAVITPSTTVDVGKPVTIRIHAVWAHNNSDINGALITVDGIGEAVTNLQGWAHLNVSRNTAGTLTLRIYGSSAPSKISFKVNEVTEEVTWVGAQPQVSPSPRDSNQPRLMLAATLSILCSIMILAVRRRSAYAKRR